MKAYNGLFKKLLIAVLTVGLLSACGGKEERKAKYLERGKAYLEEKNYDKAKIEFRNVLQIDPKDAKGNFYLGEIAEKQQNWASAFNSYKKALELDPELIEPRIRLARFNLMQATVLKAREEETGAANALALAQEQITEVMARDPGNPEGLTLEATLLANEGETDKAIQQLEKVVASEPGLQPAVVLLASLYDKQERTDEAEALLIAAVNANPEPITLQKRLAAHYVRNKQNDKAEAVLRQIVEQNPGEMDYRVSLASFLSQTDQAGKAEQVLNEAIVADPEDVQRYLLLVDFLSSRKNKDAAIEKLRQFVQQLPDMTELQLSLVKLYVSNEQEDEARQVLQALIDNQGTEPVGLRARVLLAQLLATENIKDERVPVLLMEVLAENPGDNDALLMKGRLAASNKEYVEAINDFRSVLRDQPDSAEVLQLLAAAHLANQEKELALDTLRRGVASNPGNARLHVSLARLLVWDGDTDGAIKQLDAVLAVDKYNQLALKMKYELLARQGDEAGVDEVAKLMQEGAPDEEVGYIGEARLRFAQKEYGQALAILDKVLEKNPESVTALVAKAEVLAAQQKVDEAIVVTEIVQRVQSENATGYFMKARLLQKKKDTSGAVSQYEQALSRAPNSVEVLTALTDLEMKQGQEDMAEKRLKGLLEQNPEHTSANSFLGLIYLSQKNFTAAEAAFDRQLEINPNNARTYIQLAQARLGADDLTGATRAYEQGLNVLGQDDVSLSLGLAGVKERQEDFDGAIALYEKVLEQQTDNAIATNNLAALLVDHRSDEASLAQAMALATKLEKTEQTAFLDTAGWVHYRNGDYDKAAGILEGVVAKVPEMPVFNYHLGMVYYKQGNKEAARKYLTQATGGGFDYPGIDEARATLNAL